MIYELKKTLASLKELNTESPRSDEETKMAPKVEGHLQVNSELNPGSRSLLPGADGEVSMANIMANSNRIDSLAEWNNLDRIESSILESPTTPRACDMLPKGVRPRSPTILMLSSDKKTPQKPGPIHDAHVDNQILVP